MEEQQPLAFERRDEDEMRTRSVAFFDTLRCRRSVRSFSADPVPLDVVRTCVHAAAQAPSGAHKQPWTFVMVTRAETKRAIREAAEKEERSFYEQRAPQRWLDDLQPFGTGPSKPYLEIAPVLIVVMAQRHGASPDERHYYVQESVGIATGMLLAALNDAGLATLTHTPSPMGFLAEVLERPANERPYMLIPVGYPSTDCMVPKLERKGLDAVLVEV
ncbi:MAG: nitroreductase family protein [Myxococcota bacterium]